MRRAAERKLTRVNYYIKKAEKKTLLAPLDAIDDVKRNEHGVSA